MKICKTEELTEASIAALSEDDVSNIYNGLDCCVTYEVYERLMEELEDSPPEVRTTYETALRKQAPFMEMSMRGMLVHESAKNALIADFLKDLYRLETGLNYLSEEIFGCKINSRSPAQVKTLFYGLLGLKEVKSRNSKGLYVPSVDEEALLKLKQNFWAEPFVNYILAIRDLGKKTSFLRTGIDPDNRFRSSLNIAGTVTGRTASSASEFGTGSNLQNVDRRLRQIFIPDPKKVFVNVDLEQADARNLGASIWNMFHGEADDALVGAFLDACESGDLHTLVCRMTWPELPWGDDPKKFKSIANTPFGDGDTYRDKAKKLGHGTNYLGQPSTMAVHTKTAVKVIQYFQERYFNIFPFIPKWHKRRIEQVMSTGTVTTLFGRRRMFFNRLDDSKTHRDAIAYEPQSMTGHEMDTGILNLWSSDLYRDAGIELLIQVHDSILFQLPYANLHSALPEALRLLECPLILKGGRRFSVPLEAKVGYNWADKIVDKETGKVTNPLGLVKWSGKEERVPPR